MSSPILLNRLQRLREAMSAADLPAMLITDLLNVRYVSGFSGTFGALVVTAEEARLLTDSRYTEQAAEEAPAFLVEKVGVKWLDPLSKLIVELGIKRIGFEARSVRFAEWEALTGMIEDVNLLSTQDIIEQMRQVKDESEIALLREACRITDQACCTIVDSIKPGMTEHEVAVEIICLMLKNGANKEGFDTIVASGPRSALPHGKASDRQISEGEFVVMDFGAYFQGYYGDITRTVVLGTADARHQEIYEIVLEAQRRAIEAIRPGVIGSDVDAIARNFIAQRGYGDYFGHGLGHGLGLEIHDGRILAPSSDVILRAGMVVTVEPGIYIPNWGGVRIEDDVLVTESGCELLTSCPKGNASP